MFRLFLCGFKILPYLCKRQWSRCHTTQHIGRKNTNSVIFGSILKYSPSCANHFSDWGFFMLTRDLVKGECHSYKNRRAQRSASSGCKRIALSVRQQTTIRWLDKAAHWAVWICWKIKTMRFFAKLWITQAEEDQALYDFLKQHGILLKIEQIT